MLDEIRIDYGKLSKIGRLDGLCISDQDAKVLAVNTFFDTKLNYWDIGAIGAALYGVSKQGRDFFKSAEMERSMMLYKDTQFFVQNIGNIDLENGRQRELILIIIGDKALNIGLVMLTMNRYVSRIRDQIEADQQLQDTLQMSETEFNKHLNEIKKELFQLAK
jgi:predicted regulator of Ras-like GTPase activity (Roadblock/LC7/MglB family)